MNPFATYSSFVRLQSMVMESQMVMSYRMMGMLGLWSVTPQETARMFTEKPGAFADAARDATMAVLRGESPDRVLDAAVGPLGRKTRANMRRLAKRGPARRGS